MIPTTAQNHTFDSTLDLVKKLKSGSYETPAEASADVQIVIEKFEELYNAKSNDERTKKLEQQVASLQEMLAKSEKVIHHLKGKLDREKNCIL